MNRHWYYTVLNVCLIIALTAVTYMTVTAPDHEEAPPPTVPEEVCNNADDDGDGLVDEGLTLTAWYVDADDDTWGSAKKSVQACAQPPGYVSRSKDCDDEDNKVNPGELEYILDDRDNDCNPMTADKLKQYFAQ